MHSSSNGVTIINWSLRTYLNLSLVSPLLYWEADVILTESMLKLWSCYENWENYLMKEGAKGLTNGPAFKYITILDISG